MSNTLYNAATLIGQTAINVFSKALVPLRAFTLDLSPDVAAEGSAVQSRIIPAAGTVGDLVSDHSGSYSDTVADQTATSVAVTLNKHPVESFALTDKEVAAANKGALMDSTVKMVENHVWAIANNVLNTVYAAIDTTFTAAVSAVPAASFDLDDMIDLRTYCTGTGGWNMNGASFVATSSYYGALLKDNAIQDKSASGMNIAIDGTVEMCAGFKVFEAPTLAAVAANNTGAFACKPGAFAIAMRAIQTQAPGEFAHYEVLQDPVSGVILLYSVWFDRTYRRMVHTFETLWGFADGYTTALYRVTSA